MGKELRELELDMITMDLFTSEVTLDPNNHPAPRGLTAHVSISSGSLHIRSQKGPSWGISQFLSITLICQVLKRKGSNFKSVMQKVLPGYQNGRVRYHQRVKE